MIDSISGTLSEVAPDAVVVQTGGVGFRILTTAAASRALPPAGKAHTLPVSLIVREDSLTLYGFADRAERKLFEQLIQVSGIGPRLALTILCGLSGAELCRAISDRDIRALSSIPGIGKKTAERLVLELADKVESPPPSRGAPGQADGDRQLRDAVLALVALGYKQPEARALLARIPDAERAGLDVSDLVRRAISQS